MLEFSVSKNMNDRRRILGYIMTLIVKELKIHVEQGRVVTTLHIP
jgi:hypothetical protein